MFHLPVQHLEKYSSTRYITAIVMLASRHHGLEIKILSYCALYSSVMYTETHPLVEDAHAWWCAPDTWTNLHDWTGELMFTSLKVCNLKVWMQGTSCVIISFLWERHLRPGGVKWLACGQVTYERGSLATYMHYQLCAHAMECPDPPYMHVHAQLISISSTSRDQCSYGNLGPILTHWISIWGCGPSNSMIRTFSNWCTFTALFRSLTVTQNWENFHRWESFFFKPILFLSSNPSFFFLPVLARSQCSVDLCLMSKDICCWWWSIAKLCPTLCDPMDCSTLDSLVLHYLPELAHTHVHWISVPL